MERKEEKGENGRQTSVIGYIDFPGIGSSSNWPPMYDRPGNKAVFVRPCKLAKLCGHTFETNLNLHRQK